MPRAPRPLTERVWAKVDQRGPDECWPWTGGVRVSAQPSGIPYGRIKVAGKDRPAHRVVFELVNGPTDAPCICHTCDFGLCCNPAHLFEGTHADNAADKVSKGRHRGAEKGERHHAAKVTNPQATEIRRRRLAGEPLRVIAADYGLSFQRVSQIARAA